MPGYVHRMNEERLPREIVECSPAGKSRKEIPKNLWIQEITRMREKGIKSMEWIEREE